MKNQNIMFTRNVTPMSKLRLVKSLLVLGIVALIMQVSVPRAQAFDGLVDVRWRWRVHGTPGL